MQQRKYNVNQFNIRDSMKNAIKMEVRDHECDLAGGVNNAVYCNYLEHGRHKYIKSIGVDFAEYAKKKIGLIVVRLEIDFKYPLISGDEFTVETTMERYSKIRFQFNQQIRRIPDDKIILNAVVIGMAVNESNRPILPKEFDLILEAQSN